MKKLKIKNIIIALLFVLLIIYGIVSYLNYINSNNYKLQEIGYSKVEITTINNNLKVSEIEYILKMDYTPSLTEFIVEKYFIFKNLSEYVQYYKNFKNKDTKNVITIINTNTDKDFYSDVKISDVTKGNLVLVNKYYKLNEKYVPENIEKMSLQYSYANNEIVKVVNENYTDMCNAAKSEKGYTLITTSSYRDYKLQEGLYDRYKNQGGVKYADSISARPGHSEHQVGLALDIVTYTNGFDKFEDTEEFIWLKDNAHKYGFILRYPKDSEHITGYSYEPWHYRYVGLKVAKYIYENNITFDEYYAYFIENN